MSEKSKDLERYKIKLTGPGVTIDRSVSEAMARKVATLVMGGGINVEGPAEAEGTLAGDVDGGTNVSPKAFMTEKHPTTDVERIACLAYYLTHYKHVATFKTRELTDQNVAAAQPRLSNASFAARNAVQQEYLSLAGGGKKQITARGEALVKALPDRDKVKKALEIHPIQKRRKPKRSNKTR